uniref:Putative glycosyltransferase n=1 Tax=viral metagenome TaxID=1070528 RepID=A0A6M3IZG5_9ZZZZ
MKILYFAKDSPFISSGYGKCAREILTKLAQFHEVASFATVGNKATPITTYKNLFPIYPGTDNILGEDVIEQHFSNFKADILITQMDIWPFSRLPQLAKNHFPWVAYIPIDFDPLPDFFLEKIQSARHIITMCEWAQSKLAEKGIKSTSIHHGVDTNIYKPLPEKDRLKEEIGFDKDVFLVTMVQANQLWRKAWPEQLQAFKEFAKGKENVRLYIHTFPRVADGYDIPQLVRELGLAPITRTPDDYHLLIGYSENELAKIYNASDVLLSATSMEGFGMPIAEAQCCGTPVITTGIGATKELNILDLCADPGQWFYSPNPPLRKPTPDQDQIVELLNKLYNKPLSPKQSADLSIEASTRWDWELAIIPQWLKFLSSIEPELNTLCYHIPPPSDKFKAISNKFITF